MSDLSPDTPRRLLGTADGSPLYAAEEAGRCFLLVDESDFHALLDEEDQKATPPIRVFEFRTEGEREAFLKQRGWA